MEDVGPRAKGAGLPRRMMLMVAVALLVAVLLSWRPAVAVTPYPPVPNDYDASSRVARLYSAYFLRSPDPLGLYGWTDALSTRQLSLDQVSDRFAASDEFRARYGLLSNREFVRRLYLNVLEREPDVTGWNGWTNALDTGSLTRGRVMVGFSESAEFRQRVAAAPYCHLWAPVPDSTDPASQVARLYVAYFLRQYDGPGFYGWTKALISGQLSLGQIADAFAGSAEFQGRYGSLSNNEFVRRVYHNVLDREPDPVGLAGWVEALDRRALTRGQVMVGFSESTEFRRGRALVPPPGCWTLPPSAQVPKPPPPVFPATLAMPTIGVTAQIQPGLSDVELRRGPGWTPGTAYPGVAGNMVLFGHRTDCSPYPYCGVFRNIHLLRPGHRIVVDMDGRVSTYEVVDLNPADTFSGFGVVRAGDERAFIGSAAGADWLTLIACTRASGLPTSLDYRIVVRAVRVS